MGKALSRNKGRRAAKPSRTSTRPAVAGNAPTRNDGVRYTVKEHPIYPAGWRQKLVIGAVVVLPFLGVLAAIAQTWIYGLMDWRYLAMMFGGWAITGLGITIGYHRLATHRSFETYEWVKAIWIGMGSLALEGSPIDWCAIHRRHHELSDMPGDPHSPHVHGDGLWNQLRGFWYAHTGWLFTGHWHRPELARYVPDLMSKKWLVRVDKMYLGWVAASLIAPAVIGGLMTGTWMGVGLGFLWGGLVRIFVTHHITWSINSVCHIFGTKDYKSNDDSRNNWIFGLVAWGEGWHNNHHAFPTSARHGLHWWQVDISWMIIRTMQAVGLAWDVKVPKPHQLAARQAV